MDNLAQRRNPLRFVALAFVITLPFDFYSYIGQRFLLWFGVAVIISKLVFLVLYARKLRTAWYLGFITMAAITPGSLLLIHFGSEAGKHPYSRPLFESAVVLILLLCMWKIRERYFRYIKRET
jgi:hypothetical protein